jgi:hypothetical protein
MRLLAEFTGGKEEGFSAVLRRIEEVAGIAADRAAQAS